MVARMTPDMVSGTASAGIEAHLGNMGENLQLLADLAYGDVALAVRQDDGSLLVIADARPNTAIAPVPTTRSGTTLDPAEEPEAYQALDSARATAPRRSRTARGIKYTTSAYPIGGQRPYAVVVCNLADQVAESSGAMEAAFMAAGDELLGLLAEQPLRDAKTGEPFSTQRTAGDGVMRVDAHGVVAYASPNAVNIMRSAGHDGPLPGTAASSLPGGGFGIAPVLGTTGAIMADVEFGDRTFMYRSIALAESVLVLVQDVTEARRREAELKVKEATIREVHHRAKNNLQTIASLLRIQARRSDGPAARALEEATGRVSAMAVVHDLLAGSDEERVDFSQAADMVAGLVRRGFLGEDSAIIVHVEGESGEVGPQTATALALALAELVHNALEHGLRLRDEGEVEVRLRRGAGELTLTVRDNGQGLPEGFDPVRSANLGLEIVRTMVEDDLRGTLAFASGHGTVVTIRLPLAPARCGGNGGRDRDDGSRNGSNSGNDRDDDSRDDDNSRDDGDMGGGV